MLTPELQKLKEYLEGKRSGINHKKLLNELNNLDECNMRLQNVNESLSMSSGVCPTCGKKL